MGCREWHGRAGGLRENFVEAAGCYLLPVGSRLRQVMSEKLE